MTEQAESFPDGARGETMPLELGWKRIRETGLIPLEKLLEQDLSMVSKPFPTKACVFTYTLISSLCQQRGEANRSHEMYERHGEFIEEYLTSNVMPVLQVKRDEDLLKELGSRWTRHEVMNTILWRFFMHLDNGRDNNYISSQRVPGLKSVGLRAFKTLVFDQIKEDILSTLYEQVKREHDGETINMVLFEQTLAICEAMIVVHDPLLDPTVEGIIGLRDEPSSNTSTLSMTLAKIAHILTSDKKINTRKLSHILSLCSRM